MSRPITAFATVLTFLTPSAAGAAVIASSSLDSGPVSVSFSHDVSDTSGELFSTASAAFGPDGVVTSVNDSLPGVADAPAATDDGMSADSFFSVLPSEDISFMSEASGTIGGVSFGSAIGEVTGSFEFTNPDDGLAITIMTELTRMFDFSTDIAGDLASGATSLSLALLNEVGFFLPMVTLSDPSCDPNAAFSVTDGADFANTCSTMATYLFEDLPAGVYTLTFASNSSVDVVSNIPVPAAVGLFGMGLAALGWRARRRKRTA